MRNFIKKSCLLLFFASTACTILLWPRFALSYALLGLNTWFQSMIPTLFPFMVLSGMMLRLGVSDRFAGLFEPFFNPLLRLGRSGLYCVVIGFLCGFPMGARVAADMRRMRYLTRREASYLLSFCNNIGPVFFTGYILPFLPSRVPAGYYLLGMYGVPFLYGCVGRYVFRIESASPENAVSPKKSAVSFPEALDSSVSSGLDGIAKLGGYMVFFNLLNALPNLALSYLPFETEALRAFVCLCMEITSGARIAGEAHPLMILTCLQFGGVSCIAQTLGMIAGTDLSICSYTLHKLAQSAIAWFYYSALFCIF